MKILIIGVCLILGILLMKDLFVKKFKYEDRVKITNGFYKYRLGTIVAQPVLPISDDYLVNIDNKWVPEWVNKYQLEKYED